MSGWAARMRGTSTPATRRPKARGAVRRRRPAGRRWNCSSSEKASSIWVTAGFNTASRLAPASVRDTLRVVRVNSGTPCFASSARTPLLTAVGLTFRRLAASVKLRLSATARKRRISSRELMGLVVGFYYELQVY